MNRTIDQSAELYRPGYNYVIEADATYTDYSGLRARYTDDNETPTQAQLNTADESNLTTIDLWHRFGESVGSDFITVRAKIGGLVLAAGGFANLTVDEQELAAAYFVVNRTDRLSVFGTQEDMEIAGLEFHEKAKTARHARYEKSIIHLYNLVTQPDANNIASDFYNLGVKDLYVESGVRGTLWGDTNEGILDYVNATEGTDFEPNGLRMSDAVPEEGTIDQLADDIIAIIMGGLT